MKREYPALDMNMIKSKQRKTISSKDALRDITPIEWGDLAVETNEIIFCKCHEV